MRSNDVSMDLVRVSASINVMGIHLNTAFSPQRCLISKTSNVVLNSSQEGIAKGVAKSYKERQSVIITALLSLA